jgi:hypothetical protein
MNDQAEIDTSTALALPAQVEIADLFKAKNGLDPIIDELEAQSDAEFATLDVEVAKDRKAMKSLAYKVSQSKVELERQAKVLTEAQRKEIETVNASRNKAVARLEAIRDRYKAAPAAWETKEEARIAAHKSALDIFDLGRVDAHCEVELIKGVIAEIETVPVNASWEEYEPIAISAKTKALEKFGADLEAAEIRDAERAELEELRAREAERAAKEAEEQADRERHEVERIASEEAEARRIAAEKAEADRLAQIERDKAEAAEKAAADAKAEAARQVRELEEQHQREIAEAKAREEAAAQAERDRLAAQRRAEAEAEEKRRADAEHANRIKTAIRDALVSLTAPYGDEDMELAADIATALFNGEIPHIEVKA